MTLLTLTITLRTLSEEEGWGGRWVRPSIYEVGGEKFSLHQGSIKGPLFIFGSKEQFKRFGRGGKINPYRRGTQIHFLFINANVIVVLYQSPLILTLFRSSLLFMLNKVGNNLNQIVKE